MLPATLLTAVLFFHDGNGEKIVTAEERLMNHGLVRCATDITRKYFVESKNLVYVSLDSDTDYLLKQIHTMEFITVNMRAPPVTAATENLAYMVVARDTSEFVRNVIFLTKEENWNPTARFFVIIRLLKLEELRQIFDLFLTYHVNDAVVANGSFTTELYTYNPYDKFACGNYYTTIIEFGKCLEVTADIYPLKAITGLQNCFFKVSVPHWPPFAINPSIERSGRASTGAEQIIFGLMSEIEHFKFKFYFEYDPEWFSTVSKNMSVIGPMQLLKDNLTDVMLGGLMLTPSRAKAFSFVSGHLDVDELKFMVKKAKSTPLWKIAYLEFSPTVWASLLLAFFLYAVTIVILLKAKDKVQVILILLDNLLSHGSKFHCRQSVKCVFLLWVVFTFFMNSFYTSILMSLTTKPSMDFQIRDEQTLTKLGVKPCFSEVVSLLISSQSDTAIEAGPERCKHFTDSIKTVSNTENTFTVVINSVYMYYKQLLCDEFGDSRLYLFEKPYAKMIYAIYLRNGFPMSERLHILALRIRETGLSMKSLDDLYYGQKVKHNFRSRGFKARFVLPFYLYLAGVILSLLVFVIEYVSKFNKNRTVLTQ